jgi:hypothetical protein
MKYLALFVMLGVLLPLQAANAQDGARMPRDEAGRLAEKQKELERQLARIEELMLETAKKLETKQLDNANKLREAWKAMRDKLILEDMKKLEETLREKSYGPAMLMARDIARRLMEVLEQLSGEKDREDRKKFGEAIKNALDKIDKDLIPRQTDLRDAAKKDDKDLAPEQDKLKDDTGKVERDLKDLKDQPPGVSNAGRLLEDAKKHMGDAAGKLREGKPGAEGDQDKALRGLRRAKRELEYELEVNGHAEFIQAMLDVKSKLEEMLLRQLEVNGKTTRLSQARQSESLTRAQAIELRRLARAELALHKEAQELVRKLEEERTFLFAGALRSVASDLKEVADLLDASETGDYPQLLQREIVEHLKRLIKALEETRRERPRRPEPPNGPPGGSVVPPRLVPLVAELKLLHQVESEIREKTGELDRAVKAAGGQPNFMQKKMINRLAHKQGELTEMTGRVRESLRGR